MIMPFKLWVFYGDANSYATRNEKFHSSHITIHTLSYYLLNHDLAIWPLICASQTSDINDGLYCRTIKVRFSIIERPLGT
jgi:hypothetical protein